MERITPSSGNEEIELYVRTYYSLLRSSREIPMQAVIEAHRGMHSAMHQYANHERFDVSAFIYTIMRLPESIDHTHLVLMGQSERVFEKHGYPNLSLWEEVSAPGRRRRSFYDGKDTLAVYIASRSDIDDLVPLLTCYQIERRKLYNRLHHEETINLLIKMSGEGGICTEADLAELNRVSEIPLDDLERLQSVWHGKMGERLLTIAQTKHHLSFRSLAGSLADYKRETRRWWRHVEKQVPEICFEDTPVYFVSSNTHSLINVFTSFPLRYEKELGDFVDRSGNELLQKEWRKIKEGDSRSNKQNFCYYVWKKFEQEHPEIKEERIRSERESGIYRIPSKDSFDIEVQIVDLKKLDITQFDNRLDMAGLERLVDSDAIIVNIDYPLGMAAYQVLTEIARNIAEIKGVYIMGKAATLNGRVGDVMIPGVVHDEHTLNTYLFNNCFSSDDVAPYLQYGAVMDNQKAITVQGTFLQNNKFMSVFYREGYTDMEMEGGPYLSGVYEMMRPKRHPYNQIVNLYTAPFPIGFLHYASDTPFSKAEENLSQNLSYFGVDSTYATIIALAREILVQGIK